MADVASEYECPVMIMHNRSSPKNVEQRDKLGLRSIGMTIKKFIEDIIVELEESIKISHKHGIKDENIILDP